MNTALDIADAEPLRLPLADIRIEPDLQCRANGASKTVVQEYADVIREHGADRFPAVVVFKDSKAVHWLADGFTRCAALASIDSTASIKVEIREGSRKDALAYSASANASHGLRRTNADKRRAVDLLIAAFPKWSNRRIAQACGVGHQLVGNVRPEVDESSIQEREGADGKVQRVRTVKVPAEPADALEKPLAKFKAIVALVPEAERARFAELVLALLTAPTD